MLSAAASSTTAATTAARAAFRKGNPLLKLRDELGGIFRDEDFADLFPKRFRCVG